MAEGATATAPPTTTTRGAAKPKTVIDRTWENLLGNGSFATVYRARYGDQDVAVKVINRHMLPADSRQQVVDSEIVTLVRQLAHPNVIAIFDYEDKYPGFPEVWVVMERCQYSLDAYVDVAQPNINHLLDLMHQASLGLAFLHSKNIAHRDVKPNNFLIQICQSGAVVKIADFSISKDLDALSRSTMMTVHGNRYWIAPELFDNDDKAKLVPYKRSIDVFSFGLVIVYVCVTSAGKEHLFSGLIYIGQYLKSNEDLFEILYKYWTDESLIVRLVPLLRQILSLDPDNRPSMTQASQKIQGITKPSEETNFPNLNLTALPTTSCLQPDLVFTPPRLEHLTSHNLGYKAVGHIGIGGDNHIFLGCIETNILRMILSGLQTRSVRLLQMTNGQYHQVWSKSCPPGLDCTQNKYVVDDVLISRGSDATSRCWDLQLKALHEHHVGSRQSLLGALPPHTLVYREDERTGTEHIVMYESNRQIMSLPPPAGKEKWGNMLYICRHPTSRWIALCEWVSRSLSIYDSSGCLRHHVKLDYLPGRKNSIACTDSHLIVRQFNSTVLHVHAWSGEVVGREDVGRAARLGPGEDRVWAVGVCRGRHHHLLHVAVGDIDNNVTSLHAFSIK